MTLELRFDSLKGAAEEGYRIVDIREDYEVECNPIEGVPCTHIPMHDLLQGFAELAPEQRHLLVCAHGIRSLALAQALRGQGLQVYSLQGGLASLPPD